MRRAPRLRGPVPTIAGIAVVAVAVGIAGATPPEVHRSTGSLGIGEVGERRVDAEIARYYLEEYRSGRRSVPRWDRPLGTWNALSRAQLLEPGVLKSIADDSGSVDLAASIFATRLAEGPLQRRLVERLREDRVAEATTLGSRYTIVFVPGWLYDSHGESTGADFAAPRALLSQLGIDHVMVATHENGSIEENARLIEEALAKLLGEGRELIVVSSSKGGPEVAVALASMGQTASRIAAWLNIGGLLRGTALADEATEAPKKWFVNTLLWWKGWRRDGLLSLTTYAASSRRPEDVSLPDHLLVVNLVAVPLSCDVSKRARDGYRSLRASGPNDGLTLLTDAIWPGGETLVIPRTDHFFSGVEVDRLAVAVLRTIEQTIEERAPLDRAAEGRRPSLARGKASSAALPESHVER